MGFFTKLFAKKSIPLENEALISRLGGGYTSRTGISVTTTTAMRLAACYACVRNLAEDLAKNPIHLYQRVEMGKRRASTHPLYKIVNSSPNHWQTSYEFVEMLTAHALLRGNGFARISRGLGGKVLELIPLMPSSVTIEQDDDLSIKYIYTNAKGRQITLEQDDVLHVRGLTLDGVIGITPIQYAKETFALASAAEQHGSAMFGGRVTGPGVFETAGRLSDKAYERLRESFKEEGGLENAASPIILEEGLSWKSLGIKLSDLQFIETRKFQVEEIARLYRMPLHKIGHLERATNNNIEHQSREYVTDTLLPWARRWEQALSRDCLSEKDRETFFPAFNFNNLLRGDTQSRAALYQTLFNTGSMSPNDIRRLEDDEGYEGGNTYFIQQGFMPVHLAEEVVRAQHGGAKK